MLKLKWTSLIRSTVLAASVSLAMSVGSVSPFQPIMLVAADDTAKEAATIEDAAKVLDLRTLPLPEGANVQLGRHLASLNYEVNMDLTKAFQYHKQQLTKLGWKELPGASGNESYASATYQKAGFIVSVVAYPNSDPAKKGSAQVLLSNLGNVRANKLPVVKGAKSVYGNEVTASYSTTMKLDEAAAATRKLLLDAGWEPYGSVGAGTDSIVSTFKRTGIRLTAMAGTTPAQPNQVMISYTSSLMAADIPAPPDATDVNFADVTKTLDFSTAADFDTVAKFYQQRLAKQGWKSTSATLSKQQDDFGKPVGSQVFRNEAKDILTLDLQNIDGKTRAKVAHLTAAELAAVEQRQKAAAQKLIAEDEAREQAATKQREQAKKSAAADEGFPNVDALVNDALSGALKDAGSGGKKSATSEKAKANDKDAVTMPIPEGAKKVTQSSDNVLQIKWPAGKGKAAAESLRDQLRAGGWEMEDGNKIDKTTGNVTFNQDGKKLTMSYVDTGVADVNMMLIGIGVKLAEGKADPDAKVPALPDAKKPAKATASKPAKSDDGKPGAAPPRPEKPKQGLAKLEKLTNDGKLIVSDKPIKLGSVVAYEVKVFDQVRTAIFFTEKPINLAKLKASLAKDGTDTGVFEIQSQVKVEIDQDDKLAAMHLWHDNASLSSNADLIGEVIVEDGRARGTAKLGKPSEFFGKTFAFELTFDVEVLPLPAK